MGILSTLSHSLIHQYYRRRTNAFKNDMSEFKDFQLKQLKKLLNQSLKTSWGQKYKVSGDWGYKAFVKNIPITEYKDYEIEIKKQMKNKSNEICPDCNRYQPTSGSTSGRKWIPYSSEFTQELDMAIGPWIGDLYSTYPRIKNGKHYWSLSWMPNNLREQLKDLDDLNVFSKWQQIIMRMTMASPNSISHAKNAEAAQLATLAWLCKTQDLTMIFVWSPTFALNLIEDLRKYKNDLISILLSGNWGTHASDLKEIECPRSERAAQILENWDGVISANFLEILWPKMSLISSWDTSSSKSWATKLRNLFNQASFQGKGLFATEGVVTIPFNGRYVLSYKSHFYEFEVLDELSEEEIKEGKTPRIIPSWELKNGMMVSPLISTGSGFFRYRMKDRLEVIDFMNKCPCLIFRGRMGDVDLVGEKTSPEMISILFEKIEKEIPDIKCISMMGVEDLIDRPYYLCLCEGEDSEKIQELIESEMKKNFHYTLARDLGQLSQVEVIVKQDARLTYQEIVMKKGMIKGDIKMEVLVKIKKDQLEGITK